MWVEETSDDCWTARSTSIRAARAAASRASRRGPVTGVKGMALSSLG
jgi:hypothetical protein